MTQYYVNASTGSDSNNGLTTGTAWATIGYADSTVTAGDTVNVASGNYTGGFATTKNGSAGSPITYVSTVKHGAKIVGGSPLWNNSGNYVTINGFEASGAGAFGIISGDFSNLTDKGHHFTITNCYIHDTSVGVCGQGAAIDVFSITGQSVITNNVIANVAASLIGSCATMQGVYVSDTGTYCANNIVSGVAAVGIQQWHAGTNSTFVNNTVFNCKIGFLIGQGDSGATTQGSYSNAVVNNIAANCTTGGGINGQSGANSGNNLYYNNCTYNCGYNLAVNTDDIQSNNTTGNPLFVNYQANGSGDYHLQAASPCISGGISSLSLKKSLNFPTFGFTTAVVFPATDFDGVSRPQHGTYSLGAYELPVSGTSASPSITGVAAINSVGQLRFIMSGVKAQSSVGLTASQVDPVLHSATGTSQVQSLASLVNTIGVSGTSNAGNVAAATVVRLVGATGVGAAGAVTFTPTGSYGRSSVGSIAFTESVPLQGVTGVGAVGSFNVNVPVTGVEGASAVGAVANPLAGVLAVSSVGSVTESVPQGISGIEGESAAGSLAAAVTVSLSGVAGTSGVEQALVVPAITGASGASSAGIVASGTPIAGVEGTSASNSVFVGSQLVGIAAISAAGVLPIGGIGGISVGMTGAAGTSHSGSVVVNLLSLPLSGVGASAVASIIAQINNLALLGASSASHVGALTEAVAANDSGVTGTSGAGSVIGKIPTSLLGLTASSFAGAITRLGIGTLTGVPGTSAAGLIKAKISGFTIGAGSVGIAGTIAVTSASSAILLGAQANSFSGVVAPVLIFLQGVFGTSVVAPANLYVERVVPATIEVNDYNAYSMRKRC
jgi:hypothetical protein